jgi:hypothetical protein
MARPLHAEKNLADSLDTAERTARESVAQRSPAAPAYTEGTNMKADFKIAADLTISMQPDKPNELVTLTIRSGVCDGTHHPAADVREGLLGPMCTHMAEEHISLSKSTARAIASAMMGCAAEL